MHVSAIRRYPVKSLRGEDLTEAEVEPWGLAGDRRWMVVDDAGEAITAREVNSMLLVRPTITARGLLVEAPMYDGGISPLEVDVPDPEHQQPVTIWSSELTAASAGPEADAWLSKVLGVSAHLVHLDDPRRRPADPRFAHTGDVVSFADGYPLLITTEASLAAFNDALLERTEGLGDPLPMVRFRPSLVVAGDGADLAAWAEDDWRRIRVGPEDGEAGTVLRLVKGCARCVMTTVDPETAQRGKEPTATLARIRRFDGATWFGVNAIPDVGPDRSERRTTIRVGDHVEILESVPPGGGPLRSAR